MKKNRFTVPHFPSEKIKDLLLRAMNWMTGSGFSRADIFVVAVYVCVIGFGAFYHEPWSDEALPWLIARDSTWPDLFRIIFSNWDRHPGLFHLLPIFQK